MKSFRYFTVILALAAFASCSEQNKEEPEEKPEEQTSVFSLNTSSLEFDHTGGTQQVSVTASGSWTASSTDESWCTVSPASGNGEGSLTVSVTEIPDESEGRSAKLLVSADGLTLTVTVDQRFNPDIFSIEPTSIALGPEGGDFEFTVVSHERAYEITIVDPWITEVSRSGNPFSGEKVKCRAEANPNEQERSGVVSVCTQDGSCIPVMISQSGQIAGANILAMRFTATWCGYCPYMDETFHKVAAQQERFVYVTFHASAGYPLYFKPSDTLCKSYSIDGFPTGVIGGWKPVDNYTDTDYTANKVVSVMNDFSGKFLCTAASTTTATLSGSQLSVSTEIRSTTAETYKVVALVLESGIIQAQAFYPASGGSQTLSDFSHDNVARKLLTGSILGDDVEMEAGGTKTLDWSTELDSSWNTDNLSVLVYIYRDYGNLAKYKAKSKYPNNYIQNAEIVPVQ